MFAAVISVRRRSVRSVVGVLSATLSFVAAALVHGPDASAVLKHQYTFNTAAPVGGTFQDLIGNADGTLFGSTTVSGGNTGQLILPGTGAAETGSHAALLANGVDGININTYTNATFSVWGTWNGSGDWQRYFDFGGHSVSSPTFAGNSIFMTPNAGGGPGLRFAISNVNINNQAGFDNEQSISWDQTPTNAVQRHIVGVFDGTNDQMRLYVDGVQVAQNAAPVTHMLSNLQTDSAFLGAALYPDPNFQGSINQFEIYDNALSASEVVDLFVQGIKDENPSPVPRVTVNRDTGAMTLSTNSPLQVLGYSITSARGALNSANWRTVTANYDGNNGGQFDADDDWIVLSAAGSSTDFSEFTFDTTPGNGGLLTTTFSPILGNAGAWRKSIYEDLQATLKLNNGTTATAVVSYTGGNGGAAFRRSDLNFDNAISGADWLIFRTNNLADLSTLSIVDAYAKGDLNGDRNNNFSDFLLFKADYDAFNGAGAFQLMAASVPEPTTLGLLLGGMVLTSSRLRRRARRHDGSRFVPSTSPRLAVRGAMAALFALAITSLLASSAQAVVTHHYTFNNGNANDSVGTSHGTLMDGTLAGVPEVSGGRLRLNNPGFSGPSTAANFLSLPVSILPTSGSVTIEQWFTFSGSGFFTEAWAFSDRNGGANPPGAASGQYFMHTLSNPQGGPNSAGGGSSIAQATAGYGAGSETRAYGTTVGIGADGGGYLDDGQSYYSATVLDSAAGTLNYYVYRIADGAGGLQSSIPATPLSSYSFNEAFIGKSPFDGDNATSGTVDEFRISNHALTTQQVADNFYFGPAASAGVALEVNKTTGAVTLKNTGASALAIDHYSIVSRGGALRNTWAGLGGLDSTGPGEGQSWSKAGGADANELAELFLDGSSSFDPNESHSLGVAYNPAIFGANNGDLVLQYHLAGGERLFGAVTYVTGGGCIPGDFSCSGSVGNDDLTLLLDNWGKPIPPTPAGWIGAPPTAPAVGNDELTLLLDSWGDLAGAGSVAAVPEPAAWLLALGTASVGWLSSRRRPSRRHRAAASPSSRSETMLINPRSVASIAAALLLLAAVSTASAAATKDRFYQFGDDTIENPMLGQAPQNDFGPFTGDSVALGPNDFSDLSYSNGPTYVNTQTLSRPGAATGEWGLAFNGTNSALVRVDGGLGSPEIGSTEGAYALNPNYDNITTRVMEGWVRPTNAALGRQDVVNDTNLFSIFISADDKWGFTHGGTTITSTAPVTFNGWSHVMHRTFTNTAGVLLVNGVAVAATSNDYDAAFNGATPGKNLAFGANVDQTANFFAGQMDNFSFYVAGNNTGITFGGNWGEVNLATDNDYIRQQLVGKPTGDVNLDGSFNGADVTHFIANWLSTKQLGGVNVGDITTRGKGDFDFNGVVNLDDAYTLHLALIGAGAGGLDFSLLGANVPEPGSLLLAACAAAALGLVRRRHN